MAQLRATGSDGSVYAGTGPVAQVVQIGNWISVVAPKEYDAIQAAAQLKVTWKSDPKLPGSGNFWS